MATALTSDYTHGTFFLKRRAVEYLLSCPSDDEFAANRVKALWKLALDATLRAVQSRRLTWTALAARRNQRQRYIELLKLRESDDHESVDAQEWAQLTRQIHPDDLHLWRCISMFKDRRDIVHE